MPTRPPSDGVGEDTRLLDAIRVTTRYRKDLGDLDGLMQSMASIGLLHPLVLSPDDALIAGARRLEAARRLGWATIAVRVVNLASLMHGEHDENELRKNFTVTERVAIAEALEAEIAAANAAKLREAGKKGAAIAGRGRPKVPEASLDRPEQTFTQAYTATPPCEPSPVKPRAPQTRDTAGKKAGMSGPTYTKAKAVIKAAEANPDRFGDLPAKMDADNSVDAAHKALQQRQTTDILGKSPRQMADEDAARRWTKSLHDLYVLMQSVARNAGGDILLLTATWSPTLRQQYAEELARITTVLTQWRQALLGDTDDAKPGTLPADYGEQSGMEHD